MNDYNRDLIDDLRQNAGVATLAPFTGRRLLVLHTHGARSGEVRSNPLAFSQDGDRYVVVASKGGAPTNPAWYHNLVANPEVEVELPPRTFRARATTLTEGDEYERLYKQHAEPMPTFWDYRKKTDRKIPVVVLEPIE